MLNLHHFALKHLERVLEGKDLLIELSRLLSSEATLLLLVHVDLIELLLREKLELSQCLLKGKLVSNISLVVPAVLRDLGLELGLKLFSVSNGLDFLLQVRDLAFQGVGLASSTAGGSVCASNSRNSRHRSNNGLALVVKHGELTRLAREAVPQSLRDILGQLSALASLGRKGDHGHHSDHRQNEGCAHEARVPSLHLVVLPGSVPLIDVEPDALLLRHSE
mmetsp:Transcript_72999/g.118449  ORF Transcript_72999/g.118449 Transcript_72999/m.118449 type:complete len:221 (-) Transcript_72999:41-703(-)